MTASTKCEKCGEWVPAFSLKPHKCDPKKVFENMEPDEVAVWKNRYEKAWRLVQDQTALIQRLRQEIDALKAKPKRKPATKKTASKPKAKSSK